MKTTSNYSDTMAKLASKLKTEPNKTPLQEVHPVQPAISPLDKLQRVASKSKEIPKGKEAAKEVRVNFNADESLMERIWIYSAKTKRSLKQIAVTALTEYLDRNQSAI